MLFGVQQNYRSLINCLSLSLEVLTSQPSQHLFVQSQQKNTKKDMKHVQR